MQYQKLGAYFGLDGSAVLPQVASAIGGENMNRTIASSFAMAVALGGAVLVASPAHAVTQQCDSSLYPTKVELDGSSTTVNTGLAPGTQVCIKAGTSTVVVTVDDSGNITQNAIMNKPGNAFLGISYYAYGGQYCSPQYGC